MPTMTTDAGARRRSPRHHIASVSSPNESKPSKSRVIQATAGFSWLRITAERLWLRLRMQPRVALLGAVFVVFIMISSTNVTTEISKTPHKAQIIDEQNIWQQNARLKIQTNKDRVHSHDQLNETENQRKALMPQKQKLEETTNNSKEQSGSTLIGQRSLMVQMLQNNTVARLELVWDLEPKGRKNKYWRNSGAHWHSLRSRPRKGCVPLADWQDDQHPTCNMFHEIPLNELIGGHPDEYELARLMNNGAYRDVWGIREFNGTRRVLKTLRYSKNRYFDQRNFDRHRRDAIAAEQLSASPYIANIFGYCANSALYDYSSGGDLYDIRDSNFSKNDLLIVAHDIAASIADAHHYDSKGRATIAHTDIKPNQFLNINGKYQLSDFNRCRLLSWDPEREEHCGFTVGKNGGKWRAPEEYKYEPETEKIDVFSLGYVLYFLLTDNLPFVDMKTEEANDYVAQGGRLKVTGEEILGSTHLFDMTVLKAMDMCFVYDPKKRPSAREVANFLNRAVQRIEA